jgi:hypothetical protein
MAQQLPRDAKRVGAGQNGEAGIVCTGYAQERRPMAAARGTPAEVLLSEPERMDVTRAQDS